MMYYFSSLNLESINLITIFLHQRQKSVSRSVINHLDARRCKLNCSFWCAGCKFNCSFKCAETLPNVQVYICVGCFFNTSVFIKRYNLVVFHCVADRYSGTSEQPLTKLPKSGKTKATLLICLYVSYAVIMKPGIFLQIVHNKLTIVRNS